MSTLKKLLLAATVSAFAGCITAPPLSGVSVGNLQAAFSPDCPAGSSPPPSICVDFRQRGGESLAPIIRRNLP
jgi:hypothetical protein